MSYKEKPVLIRVQLQGLTQAWTLEEDHKFFDKVKKYTAAFGPIGADDLNQRLTLEVYSRDGIKAKATRLTVKVSEKPDLNAGDKLPEETLTGTDGRR